MYMMMSLSGSSDSRINNCAINKFATVSSTGVPRKMMRSFARREYGSHSMRPRGVSWMNRGIGTYSLRAASPRSLRIFSWLLFFDWFALGNREIDFVAFLIDHARVI